MRRAILLAGLVAATAATSATPSTAAAPKPQISDPKGDAIGAQPGADLVSVTYATTGVGSGRRYVPKKLVVTMTMAGDVITQPGLTYEVEAMTSACDLVTFSAQQGSPYSSVTGVNGWAEWGSCAGAGGDIELITVKAAGNTLTWSFPLKMIPKDLTVGTTFSDFAARIDPTNPAIPFPSSQTRTKLGLVDAGAGDVTWTLR
ncbi:MAG TPA: hypothetical protein VF519_15500 [Mycobacteriales bacterium]|jgi:hypothetical protein